MKRVNLVVITLALAVIFLVIEVIIVKSAAKYEPEVTAVYAKTRIPAEKEITADMLYERKISISMAHKQSVRNVKDLVGKKSKVDIEEGEMILSSKLGQAGEMEEIEVKDKNNRLFTVEFKGDQANGWWLLVGQYVDIIFVPNERLKQVGANSNTAGVQPSQAAVQAYGPMQDTSNEDYGWITGINGVKRLRNVRVAALIDEKGKLLKNSNRQSVPKYISFEVTDKQDELLAYAKSNGRLEVSVIPGK